MRRIHWGLAVALVLSVAWVGSTWPPRGAVEGPDRAGAGPSIVELLARPVRLPFAGDTSLADVADFLRETLEAPVVIDRAALDRLGITEEETVRLDLDGVRLVTGLRLLLDQVGMSYRVEEADNLLVLTDKEGSEEPLARVLGELEALHRDVHDLQDTVDELYDAISPEDGPAVRSPTIIEEMPEGDDEAADGTPKRTRTG